MYFRHFQIFKKYTCDSSILEELKFSKMEVLIYNRMFLGLGVICVSTSFHKEAS